MRAHGAMPERCERKLIYYLPGSAGTFSHSTSGGVDEMLISLDFLFQGLTSYSTCGWSKPRKQRSPEDFDPLAHHDTSVRHRSNWTIPSHAVHTLGSGGPCHRCLASGTLFLGSFGIIQGPRKEERGMSSDISATWDDAFIALVLGCYLDLWQFQRIVRILEDSVSRHSSAIHLYSRVVCS